MKSGDMKHLTDEAIMEQIYGESEDPAAVQRHLEGCRDCARNLRDLKRDLAEVHPLEAPPRDARYGERVWAAISPLLAVYPAPDEQPWWRSFVLLKTLSYVAATALLTCCAFYAGRVWQQKQQPHVAFVNPASKTAPQEKQPVVVVVLDDHLDRSERFLVELKHADLDSSAMASPMSDEARSLLAANRVCRKNAAQTKDLELTTALDHLDKLLADAANEPGGLNAASITRLQDEMNSQGVLFEVRVLRSRAAHYKTVAPHPGEGGTI
jgi:hypothetical protein